MITRDQWNLLDISYTDANSMGYLLVPLKLCKYLLSINLAEKHLKKIQQQIKESKP